MAWPFVPEDIWREWDDPLDPGSGRHSPPKDEVRALLRAMLNRIDEKTWFVVANMDPTEGSDLTNSIARGMAAGYRSLFIEHSGAFQIRQADLSDFVPNSDPWATSATFNVWGRGEEATIVSQIDPAARYMFGQPSWGGTTNRGQMSGLRLGEMTLKGLSLPGNNQPLIALSNTAKLKLANMTVGGNQAGPLIELYSHTKGGLWSARLDNVNSVRHKYVSIGAATLTDSIPDADLGASFGSTFADLAVLRAEYGRYFVRLNGPRDNTGKVNDTALYGCDINNMLIGGISTEGHGTFATGFPGGGGSDNLIVDKSNFIAAQATRKIEEGFTGAVTNGGLTIELRTDYFVHDQLDAFKDCSIVVRGADGIWRAAWIDGMEAATRRITVDRVVSGIASGLRYRIMYGDAVARAAGWDPMVGPHALYWEPSSYRARWSPRTEEVRNIVAHTSANTNVAMVNQYRVVDNGDPACRTDGSSWSATVVSGCAAPQGGGTNGALNAHHSGGSYRIVGDGGIFRDKINNTGAAAYQYDVVRENTSGDPKLVSAALNYTAGSNGKHSVVYSASGNPSLPGGDIAIVIPGQEVRVNFINDTASAITVTEGQWAVSKAGVALSGMRGGVTAIDDASITSLQRMRAVGRVTKTITIAANTVTPIRIMTV